MEFASGVMGSEPPVNGSSYRVPLRHAGQGYQVGLHPFIHLSGRALFSFLLKLSIELGRVYPNLGR